MSGSAVSGVSGFWDGFGFCGFLPFRSRISRAYGAGFRDQGLGFRV